MFEEIKKSLLDQWAVIEQATSVFIMAVLLVAAIIWAAMRWAYGARLQNKESLIDLQKAQLEDYKAKLGGASPDEARARIDALQTQLDNLVKTVGPRILSDEQLAAITRAASQVTGNPLIDVLHDMAVPDGKRLSAQLGRAFQNAGWRVSYPAVMGISNPPPSGLAVYVESMLTKNPAELAVIDGLRAAGLQFDAQQQPGMGHPEKRQVGILVTSKVE